jgi:hypothetical protein
MSRLDDAMHRLAGELAEAEVPSHVESAVLAEFGRSQRHRRVKAWGLAAAAVAASLTTVWIARDRPVRKPATPAVVETEAEQPFVPIPYVLPPAPYERVEIVRMQVPVAALISAGVPVGSADPGAQAEADVLVGQDGRPRAVRLISISSFN